MWDCMFASVSSLHSAILSDEDILERGESDRSESDKEGRMG
jgi:hypothetical protein